MEYKLNKYYRNISDEEFLIDIKNVATSLNVLTLSKSEYSNLGKYCASTIEKRFLTWGKACEKAGLNINYSNIKISDNDIIVDLKNVANTLNKNSIKCSEYKELGKFHTSTVIKKFGGWNNALYAAGLKQNLNKNMTNIDMFNEIERIWILLGRQPTSSDIKAGTSIYSLQSYARRFEGWRNALEAFVNFMNDITPEFEQYVDNGQSKNPNKKTLLNISHSTKRDINFRLRFLVMKRDSFRCCACGASPAKDPSVELHVDHIIPWSKGGETVIDNLQTLCSKCNLGKSDIY